MRINARHAEKGAAAVDFVERQIGGLPGANPGPHSRGRAEFVARLEDAVADAWLVIESVPERLELKRQVFAQLESAAPRDAILASNSSSYASRLIVAGLWTTDRMLNTHFYMPPTQIAVDVILGNTSQQVLDFVMETLPDYGLRPFLVRRESTGFIFNRIWAAIKREALDVVAGGVATPTDVDEMWKLLFGTQIGPFRAMEKVGLDVVYDIEQHYAAENPTLPAGPRNLLRQYLDAGKLGGKTGAGFYADYADDSRPKPQD